MENIGNQIVIIKTVFTYKINVAIAAILIFVNIQTTISFALDDAVGTNTVLFGIMLTLALLAYGLLSLNGFLSKIIVHQNGFTIKSLLAETTLHGSQIKKAVFNRINLRKMKITITMQDGKQVNINTAKYVNTLPLVEFLANYKG